MNNEQKELVIKLVTKYVKNKTPISSVKPIHLGYTNQSYVVTYDDGVKYQVRLPHCGNLLNRANEKLIHDLRGDDSFVYFDVKTGNAIKRWIPGKPPRVPFWSKWRKVDELFSAIKKIHQIKPPKNHRFKKIDYEAYSFNLYRLKLTYQTKFMSIIDTYKNDSVVLNHTDINPQNLILDDNDKLHIIDFEWAGLASDYWDYANFIRESGIMWFEKINWNKYIDNFDLQKLKDYIYVCSIYAYLWTWYMPQTRKIKRYRQKALRQIYYYSKGVISNDK